MAINFLYSGLRYNPPPQPHMYVIASWLEFMKEEKILFKNSPFLPLTNVHSVQKISFLRHKLHIFCCFIFEKLLFFYSSTSPTPVIYKAMVVFLTQYQFFLCIYYTALTDITTFLIHFSTLHIFAQHTEGV